MLVRTRLPSFFWFHSALPFTTDPRVRDGWVVAFGTRPSCPNLLQVSWIFSFGYTGRIVRSIMRWACREHPP